MFGALFMIVLNATLRIGVLGSPFAAYLVRYSTQAKWSITTYMSQLALQPCSWSCWWLFNRESFLMVTIFALYCGSLSFI